jgi:hypothetical protein
MRWTWFEACNLQILTSLFARFRNQSMRNPNRLVDQNASGTHMSKPDYYVWQTCIAWNPQRKVIGSEQYVAKKHIWLTPVFRLASRFLYRLSL